VTTPVTCEPDHAVEQSSTDLSTSVSAHAMEQISNDPSTVSASPPYHAMEQPLTDLSASVSGNAMEQISNDPSTVSASASDHPTGTSLLASVPTVADCGRWCIVRFDDCFYPGSIQQVETDRVRVSVLHPIGCNKFIHPKRLDELWYDHADFVGFIDEPFKPTPRSRFMQVKDWHTRAN